MRRVFVSVFIVLFSFSLTYAEDYIDLVKKGNDAFNNKDYKKALEYYHYAETEIPESPELEYNMAGALTEDGGYEQAVDKYTKALNTSDLSLEAKTHYNLGNTYYWMKDYQNANSNRNNRIRSRNSNNNSRNKINRNNNNRKKNRTSNNSNSRFRRKKKYPKRMPNGFLMPCVMMRRKSRKRLNAR